MRPVPIRSRLTLWYFSILTVGLLTFAFVTLAVLRHAVHRNVDRQLDAHMAAVRQIINEDENRSPSALSHDLDEDVELAPDLTLLEIWGPNERIVYRSPAMNRMQIPDLVPPALHHPITRRFRHYPVRVLVRNVSARGANYVVMVAIPIQDFTDAIHQVEKTLWIVIPLLLVFSIAGGYWISDRAFSPIRSMIAATDAIHPGDLSTRITVPRTDDEVQRLALTLNRMLGRLQAGFERITRFTADASHELRTPIALLRTRTEILLRRPRSTEEYRAALESNLEELEKTSGLLERLMFLARADAGAETLHFTDIDLTELMRATVASAEPLAEMKLLGLSVVLPAQPVKVCGDEAALRRLLLVLIDNAVKYTPEKGNVRIALETEDAAATVEVSDTGIGISKEVLPYIFDRFYRADIARAADGAGLGLSIGNWIAEQHGGRIIVRSTVTEGSTFTFTLPLSRK